MAKNIRKVGLLKDSKPATKPAFQTDNATTKEQRWHKHGPDWFSMEKPNHPGCPLLLSKVLSYLLLLLILTADFTA